MAIRGEWKGVGQEAKVGRGELQNEEKESDLKIYGDEWRKQ